MTVVLSDRQYQALVAIQCGADTEELAEQLGVSYWVAHKHIKTLRRKLGATALHELPGRAAALGVELPDCPE